MSRITRATVLLGVGLLAGAVTLVPMSPAGAEKLEGGTFVDEFSFTDDDFCGTGREVLFEGVAEGRFLVRTQGPDGLVDFGSRFSQTVTATDVATGQSTTEVTRINDKDLHVTDQGDGTLLVEILATGPSSLYGDDGSVIGRNPGQVRFELVVDHGGTPDFPDDDVELSFEQVRDSTGRTDDFCAVTLEYWGF